MRTHLLNWGVAMFLVTTLTTAAAQSVITGPPITSDELDLPSDREVLVREYVIRGPAPRIIIEGGVVRPGSIVPEDVQLHPFDNLSVAGMGRYAYFVSPDEKIVIVDPSSRRVVRIIDRR